MASDTDRPRALRRGSRFLATQAMLATIAATVVTTAVTPAVAQQPTPAPKTTPKSDAAAESAPAIDTAAVAIVKRMGAYLRTIQAFRLQVESSTDEVLVAGPKIQYGRSADIVVRRPDRLRADVRTDEADRQLFYDGKTLTVYGKRANYYATVPAPPTLDALIDTLTSRYGIELPVTDVLYGSASDVLLAKVTAGLLVGPAFVGGVECDHLAFHQAGLDWQLWVERGDRPLPRKLVLTTLDEPSQPQHQAVMTWDLAPTIDDATFAFTPPADAGRILLAEMGRSSAPRPTKPK
jgi:hypothetical protein